jgi:hypothetical protein
LTCPDLVPGSVTGQSGAVNGWTSAFVDAFGDRLAPEFNWQYILWLSDKQGAGGHYQANQTVKGEHRLSLNFVGGRPDLQPCPLPDPSLLPFTFDVTQSYQLPDDSGNWYAFTVVLATYSATSCKLTQKNESGGTITLTRVDDLQVEGSYADLAFQGVTGSLTGTFVAPRAGAAGSLGVDGCPTRPGSPTCVG